MKEQYFESVLRRDGFAVDRRVLPAGTFVAEHAEPIDVRALVMEGEMTLTFDGCDYACREGDIFVLPAGIMHSQTVGADGVDYVVCRRNADASAADDADNGAQVIPRRTTPVTDTHV